MQFDGWAVSESLVNKIKEILLPGSTILELGSGDGSTAALSIDYKLISIEENEKWLNKYINVNYIYCPLKPHKELKNYENMTVWFDAEILRPQLAGIEYDLLLVDGPSSPRAGLIKYWDMFKSDVPIIVDDLQRVRDWKVTHGLSSRVMRPYTIYPAQGEGKPFALIHGPKV